MQHVRYSTVCLFTLSLLLTVRYLPCITNSIVCPLNDQPTRSSGVCDHLPSPPLPTAAEPTRRQAGTVPQRTMACNGPCRGQGPRIYPCRWDMARVTLLCISGDQGPGLGPCDGGWESVCSDTSALPGLGVHALDAVRTGDAAVRAPLAQGPAGCPKGLAGGGAVRHERGREYSAGSGAGRMTRRGEGGGQSMMEGGRG